MYLRHRKRETQKPRGEADKDDNKDGANDNDFWNMGAEGPTDNEKVNRLRERKANILSK
jgi:isoamylase